MKRTYCANCGDNIDNCLCGELAMTVVDSAKAEGLVHNYRRNHQNHKDCSTCNSYNCTECPRYSNY